MTPIERARQALELLDLTSLNDDDSEQSVAKLCARAVTRHGHVAAVCVWPRFVAQARASVARHGVRVAAVANFPHGAPDIAAAEADCRLILRDGGDEVDVVFPWRAFLAGDRDIGQRLVAACSALCRGRAKLKVILESGEIGEGEALSEAAQIAIAAGADFIKTSTGKTKVSATPGAARIMLQAIRASGRQCGFKASGGIRDMAAAVEYLNLAATIMGEDWISRDTFRFGASGLLDSLLAELNGTGGPAAPTRGY